MVQHRDRCVINNLALGGLLIRTNLYVLLHFSFQICPAVGGGVGDWLRHSRCLSFFLTIGVSQRTESKNKKAIPIVARDGLPWSFPGCAVLLIREQSAVCRGRGQVARRQGTARKQALELTLAPH